MKVLKTSIIKDHIISSLQKQFDIEFESALSFTVPEFYPPEDFSIGCIVGASGSGKTQLLKHHFSNISDKTYRFHRELAIASYFEDAEEAKEKLLAVGLCSIPTWFKPYHVLSNGEKTRFKMALRLNSYTIFDEFTSLVNREVAKSLSISVARYIREKGYTNVVFATCHKDILEWLRPNWVFDCDCITFN